MKITYSFIRATLIVPLALFSCARAQTLERAATTQERGGTTAKITTIPVEITSDNYIFIQARINGSQPLTFILDTAAGSGLVLDLQRAQALGLKLQGKGSGGGTGEGNFETTSAKGVSLGFPGAELSNQTFVVYSSEKLPSLGRRVDGVIGSKLFSRYVVEIDYAAYAVSLYEPKSYQYTGSGESVPLTILSNLPFVTAAVAMPGRKAIEGGFLIDTGAGKFTFILNTPFVESNKLLSATQKIVREPAARGVGGETKLFAGRIGSLQLGRFTLADPVIHFSQDRQGSLASSEFNGVIGGELLRRFKVIFDYAHKRMILEPNAHLAERFEYDMSGVRLRAEGKDFRIFKVRGIVEHSPAAEAGLREEDVIVAINGRPAAEFKLDSITRMFMQGGQEYVLSLKRGREIITTKIKLTRLI